MAAFDDMGRELKGQNEKMMILMLQREYVRNWCFRVDGELKLSSISLG